MEGRTSGGKENDTRTGRREGGNRRAENLCTESGDRDLMIQITCFGVYIVSCKEERSKQGQTNNKAKQHSTPKARYIVHVTCTFLSFSFLKASVLL